MTHRILVSGAGSIGKRHLKNLRSLGITDLSIADPVAKKEEFDCPVFTDFSVALTPVKPDIVFVCSPTKLHLSQALEAAHAGAHLFIEKPLSSSLNGTDDLLKIVKEKHLHAMVGCNMRFHFGPKTVKKLLDDGVIGKITSAEVCTASYLPDWRPTQDYKKSYSADPEHGGAILDCIHEIDLALWYFGPAVLSSCTKKSAEELGLNVEGTADLHLLHTSGEKSHVHLSFMEHGYKRFAHIKGEKGSISWDIGDKKVVVKDSSGTVAQEIHEPASYDINQMYLDEVSYFLGSLESQNEPMGTLEEALNALKIALQARGK